ncbi:MAG: hypothetical protein OXC62_01765 [Aestuariivita sp.]|nr:hypothetical protein [Aestuariivita sp.]
MDAVPQANGIFGQKNTAEAPTLDALRFWQSHHEKAKKSTFPDTAPLGFVTKPLILLICPNGAIDRAR